MTAGTELNYVNGAGFVALGVGVIVVAAVAGLSLKQKRRRREWNKKKDVVILHMFARGKLTPNISPFPLKLETYLRMAGIQYEPEFDEPMGPKGKCPWITFHGKDIADSQLCLEYLAKTFHKDFSSHLTPEQKACARAIQIMAEEHLLWVLALWRWDYTKGKNIPMVQPFPKILMFFMPLLVRQIKTDAKGQGMGRHTKEEVIEMGMKDLRAISDFLGSKPFFMGDEPCEVDCALFGMLSQFLWNLPHSPYETHLQQDGQFSNLRDFCLRMKTRFWPDWEDCLHRDKP